MISIGIKNARITQRSATTFHVSHPCNDAILATCNTQAEAETVRSWLNALGPNHITRDELRAVLEKLDLPLDAAHDEHGGISRALRSAFVKLMELHDSMPRLDGKPHPVCAVEGCPKPGKRQTCPADGTMHGHGCIHSEHCHTALTFRKDQTWHLICDEHYAICVQARRAWECAMSTARSQLATMLASTPCQCTDDKTCPHEQVKKLRREIAVLEKC